MSTAEVFTSKTEEVFLPFVDAFFFEALTEFLIEVLVTRNEAGVHEGCFALLVTASFTDAFVDRSAGVANLKATIPEGVENFLNEC